MGANKFYVVFAGRKPGIYINWEDAREQVEGFPGAKYKGYATSQEATMAWRGADGQNEIKELGALLSGAARNTLVDNTKPSYLSFPEVDTDAWAVDASCMGNPGRMEYRGVDLKTGRELFKVGPYEKGTNNIGEFLAIVHAMALMARNGEYHNIYSDSRSAMAWVRKKQINTKLKPSAANEKLFQVMARALTWLRIHNFPKKVLKWQTETWGEIPADFGRK